MAVTRERKLEVARRSYTLLTEKYEIPAEDILFDPLVFPCGTGDAKYVGSAVETIEGIRLIKAAFPETKTILGISNVSFGLPEAGREVLNSVFLYHATKAGLDLAIVNSEKIVRYPSIPDEEKRLAEDLLWNRGEDPVAAFANYFKAKGDAPKAPQRARRNAAREAAAATSWRAPRKGWSRTSRRSVRESGKSPLDIINGPLMDGMREVGTALQRERAHRRGGPAVGRGHEGRGLAPRKFMEKSTGSRKGKVILATVKGDVHDIGKNLVEIILSNNGYEVDQPRHQGPAREARRGVREARARSDRPLGSSREERAADGHDRAGPDGGGRRRRRCSSAARRSRRSSPITASRRPTEVWPSTPRTPCAASPSPTGFSRARTRARGSWRRREKRRAAIAAATRSDQEIPLSAPAVRSTEVSDRRAGDRRPTARSTSWASST